MVQQSDVFSLCRPRSFLNKCPAKSCVKDGLEQDFWLFHNQITCQNNVALKQNSCICFLHSNNMISVHWFVSKGLIGMWKRRPHLAFFLILFGMRRGPFVARDTTSLSDQCLLGYFTPSGSICQ